MRAGGRRWPGRDHLHPRAVASRGVEPRGRRGAELQLGRRRAAGVLRYHEARLRHIDNDGFASTAAKHRAVAREAIAHVEAWLAGDEVEADAPLVASALWIAAFGSGVLPLRATVEDATDPSFSRATAWSTRSTAGGARRRGASRGARHEARRGGRARRGGAAAAPGGGGGRAFATNLVADTVEFPTSAGAAVHPPGRHPGSARMKIFQSPSPSESASESISRCRFRWRRA